MRSHGWERTRLQLQGWRFFFFYSRNASKGKRKTRKTAAENKQLDPPICSSQLSRFISIDSAAPRCPAHARSSIGVESCLGSIMLMSSSAERRASSGDITLVTSREANFQMCPHDRLKMTPTDRFRAPARPRCRPAEWIRTSSCLKCLCVYLRPL